MLELNDVKRKDLADLLSRAAAFCEDTDSLDHEDRMALVEDLLVVEAEFRPAGVALVDGPTVKLNFNPQAWLNDYAVSVDPEGDTVWEVSRDEFLKQFPTERDFYDQDYCRDHLRFEGTAPPWVRDWSGPFEVEIIDDPWKD